MDRAEKIRLRSFCGRLYGRRCGKSPKKKGLKLHHMVSEMEGRPMGRNAALTWLKTEFAKPENSKIQLPKISRARGVSSKAFYASDAWRSIRFTALKAADGCCVLCGRSKREHGIVLHVDHSKPRSLHPELELDRTNLQVLCEDCNLGKSNRCDRDWR